MMLTISPELALAFETGTLARWKAEISALLRRQFPDAAALPGSRLEDWVREAMETIRRAGATSRMDIELFAVTLFRITEVEKDDRAAGDFMAIMLSQEPISARMALLRKAFAGLPE
jgi:hypothetical protein